MIIFQLVLVFGFYEYHPSCTFSIILLIYCNILLIKNYFYISVRICMIYVWIIFFIKLLLLIDHHNWSILMIHSIKVYYFIEYKYTFYHTFLKYFEIIMVFIMDLSSKSFECYFQKDFFFNWVDSRLTSLHHWWNQLQCNTESTETHPLM